MPDLIDLERRVSALEKAQKETAETQTWMASTLGRIAAVQDDHTQRLESIETRLGKVEVELSALRRDLPSIVAEAMRDVLKERG
jgi:hypothetical protein